MHIILIKLKELITHVAIPHYMYKAMCVHILMWHIVWQCMHKKNRTSEAASRIRNLLITTYVW